MKKILWAEDHQMVREHYVNYAEEFYKRKKIEVAIDQISDGEDLVARVIKEQIYDLIVTDQNMPKVNGIEAIAQIREKRVNTPAYLYSTKDCSKMPGFEKATGFFLKGELASFDRFLEESLQYLK